MQCVLGLCGRPGRKRVGLKKNKRALPGRRGAGGHSPGGVKPAGVRGNCSSFMFFSSSFMFFCMAGKLFNVYSVFWGVFSRMLTMFA